MTTEYCENLACYISSYRLRGFDVYKFHDKGMVTFYRIYFPNGGDMALQTDLYSRVKEFISDYYKRGERA